MNGGITITLPLNFTILTILTMLLFAAIGWLRGWKAALVTLVGLFFAWGLAMRTADFLIAAIKFASGYDFGGEMKDFFKLGLYVSSVVMVVYTFNSIIGEPKVVGRARLTGGTIGLLNGYFFMLLLLDLARDWLDTHVNNWTLTLNLGYTFDVDPNRLTVIIKFTNNARELYPKLLTVQNIVLLLVLLVFLHGLIFGLLGMLDRSLKRKAA
ncbi:MAG: hypothetical protein M5U01_25710 [Ardenticatenaceae bacterium]|nr:hypothetical protein [Ardenticatenaceae bacterium]HBY97787.1 hypothetical protein [Chloroflexota bacterium]